MQLEFQLLDCDYIILENTPVVRLFGKTKDGKSACAFYKGYFPYFYISTKKHLEESDLIEEVVCKNAKAENIKLEGLMREPTTSPARILVSTIEL